MRFLIPAAALALLAAPALAQTTTVPATPAPAAPAPVTTEPASPPAAAAPTTPPVKHAVTHHRRTLQQRFDAANTTHDGHLTRDQAAAAKWSYVIRHFAAMDTAKKGYVTMAEISAYAKAQRAKYHHHKTTTATPAPATAPATPANGSGN